MTNTNNCISPFYKPEVLDITSKYFPFIKHDQFRSMPLVKDKQFLFFNTMELVGKRYADYRSIIDPEVNLKRILDLHESDFKHHVIEMGSISERDPSFKDISDWVSNNKLLSYKKEIPRSPYISIDISWDDYMARKKRKFRYNLSRAERLLEKRGGKLSFKILSKSDDILQYIDRCIDLYKTNWNKFTSNSIFVTEKGGQFLKDLLSTLSEEDKVELCIFEQSGSLLSFSIGFKFDSIYYFYIFSTTRNPSFATYSVGKIHIRYLLESVFKRDFKIFDFMAGEEGYKYEWTKTSQKRVTYYVMSNGVLNKLLMFMFANIDRLAAFLKKQKFLRQVLKKIS